ncbi:hypothetical protein MCOR25_010829 [Pyricularia grisea]|nr:hypothetical protein MCOR25_010829 [Pyricularia grisea]
MENRNQIFKLRPFGGENDQDEERIHATIFDYTVPMSYNAWAIYFKLDDQTSRPKVVEVLKTGLERTISQCRQLVGRFETNLDDDGYSFVKRKDDTVDFIVEYWDDANVPSLDEIQKAHFASSILGDVGRFCAPGMECGQRPACHPENKPVLCAFKANFIQGGLIFVMNHLHYCQDVMGWSSCARQLAGNCAAAMNGTGPPPWDPAAITDGDRFTPKLQARRGQEVEEPRSKPCPVSVSTKPASSLLIHLSKSKAIKLKKVAADSLATCPNPLSAWISTYDAFVALIWRTLTRHRRELYRVGSDEKPLLRQAINLRYNDRLNPPVADKFQRNLLWSARTQDLADQFTVAQIAETEPLGNIAARIRELTLSITQPAVEAAVTRMLALRDKSSLARDIKSLPPLSMVVTDWRRASLEGCDFGFGCPCAFRHLTPAAAACMVVVFPPRLHGQSGKDEGPEIALSVENELVNAISNDSRFTEFFEVRGYEVMHKDLVRE